MTIKKKLGFKMNFLDGNGNMLLKDVEQKFIIEDSFSFSDELQSLTSMEFSVKEDLELKVLMDRIGMIEYIHDDFIDGQQKWFIIDNIARNNDYGVIDINALDYAAILRDRVWKSDYEYLVPQPFEVDSIAQTGQHYYDPEKAPELDDGETPATNGKFRGVPLYVCIYDGAYKIKKLEDIYDETKFRRVPSVEQNYVVGAYTDVIMKQISDSTYIKFSNKRASLSTDFMFDSSVDAYSNYNKMLYTWNIFPDSYKDTITFKDLRDDHSLLNTINLDDEYKGNLVNISKTESRDAIVNRLYPRGEEGLDLTNSTKPPTKTMYIQDWDSIEKYGLKEQHMKYNTLDPYFLRIRAEEDFKQMIKPEIIYDIDLIATHDLALVQSGDIAIFKGEEYYIQTVRYDSKALYNRGIISITISNRLDTTNPQELIARAEDMKDDKKMEEIKNEIKNDSNFYNEIVGVVKEDIMDIEGLHSRHIWTEYLSVDTLETGLRGNHVKNEMIEWDEKGIAYRDYIKAHKGSLSFISEKLDKTLEPVDVMIDTLYTKEQLYYTAIDDHPDAYRYFTLTKPSIIHKDITEENEEAFKVKKWQSIKTLHKFSLDFTMDGTSGNHMDDMNVILTIGAGASLEDVREVLKIKKFKTAAYIDYHNEGGSISGFKLDDRGVTVDNARVKNGRLRVANVAHYEEDEPIDTSHFRNGDFAFILDSNTRRNTDVIKVNSKEEAERISKEMKKNNDTSKIITYEDKSKKGSR